jgi:hypothetical protein
MLFTYLYFYGKLIGAYPIKDKNQPTRLTIPTMNSRQAEDYMQILI